MVQISASYLLPVRSYERRKFLCTHMVKVVNHTGVSMLVQLYFSIIVTQICMKIGVDITPNSGCLTLALCHWSSFGFGVENILVSRFVSPFKCTVNTNFKSS